MREANYSTALRHLHELEGSQMSHGIHSVEDARLLAKRRLPRMVFDFIDGAAGSETNIVRNREALDRTYLLPRALVDVEGRDLSTELFGQDLGLPFGIAPMGLCNLAWPGADNMLAAAAVQNGVPHCLSTAGSATIANMASLAGKRAWFQLYVSGSQDAALELVDRAADAGIEVLQLTVDVPQLGRRRRELRHGFKMPIDWTVKKLWDFASHPHWTLSTLQAGTPTTVNLNYTKSGAKYDRHSGRGAIDFGFLDRLREHWRGKLVVKGILAPEDAIAIRDAGADAVQVSSHGGRQLDGGPPSIVMLPAIREAVGPDFPLIYDSGVRSGEDIVKALALGANFVMLGRPWLYAIAGDGKCGLDTLFEVLKAEIDITLAQIGKRRIADIGSGVLTS